MQPFSGDSRVCNPVVCANQNEFTSSHAIRPRWSPFDQLVATTHILMKLCETFFRVHTDRSSQFAFVVQTVRLACQRARAINILVPPRARRTSSPTWQYIVFHGRRVYIKAIWISDSVYKAWETSFRTRSEEPMDWTSTWYCPKHNKNTVRKYLECNGGIF